MEHAERLSAGLERLTEGDIDVILLDLGLPDSQGLETLGDVLAEHPHVPAVVMIAGLDDEALAVQTPRAVAQDRLIQGHVDGNLLARALRYAIERKRAEKKLRECSVRLEEMVQERTRELREAQKQLVRREKLAVLGQLAGGVGHELRNPLGTIKNAAYVLRMVLEDPDVVTREVLEVLDREVGTMEKIISSLLDLARTGPPTRRMVDLNDVVREALSRIALPDAPRVEVVLQLDEDLPPILADPDQLFQVLGNIVRNGIQAMSEGGRLTIKTSEAKSGEVVVSIATLQRFCHLGPAEVCGEPLRQSG